MSTEKFSNRYLGLSATLPEIKPICEVTNNNLPGWQNTVETPPGITLDVGTKLYLQKDVLKIFFALEHALQRVDQLEKREATVNTAPVATPKLKSDPPKGVMAALLTGWAAHKPVIHWVGALPDHKPWVSLWGPRDSEWHGMSCNFDLEPELVLWLQWAAADKQREICRSIQKALGMC